MNNYNPDVQFEAKNGASTELNFIMTQLALNGGRDQNLIRNTLKHEIVN